MNPPAVSTTEWFLSSMTSEIAHSGRMTSAHWKFAVAARPSQVSERLIVTFAESGNWHSACAEGRAPSFRRLRLRHSDPWNVKKRCHRPTCTSVHDGAIVSQRVPRGNTINFFYATTTFETHLELQLCRYLPSCPDTFPKTFSASFHHNNTLVEPNTFDHEPVTLRSFNAAAT